MDGLILFDDRRKLRTFPLADTALEVGTASECDIVVHDEGVPARKYLIFRRGGAVWVQDLAERMSARPLGRDEVLPLGAYRLVRGDCVNPQRDGHTNPLGVVARGWHPKRVLVGHGASTRSVAIEAPLFVGSLPANDLVIPDPAVSARHCLLEPTATGVAVRDLGSRNGTWVDGVRATRALARPGSRVRVGSTDLQLSGPEAGLGGDCVAASHSMCAVLTQVERWAPLCMPVLVLGETGSGKEAVASQLHSRSPRADRPFVALNAGGLPSQLIESELFGHEQGAFTGAAKAHRGVFEQADGGTLFLDEIGELPLEMQTRLLRVLETWRIRRVGAESDRPVDVRLVCATHRDLRAMAEDGRFRLDLYYRVARLVVRVPPLRQRPEDVAPLVDHFLARLVPAVGPREFTDEALVRLLEHDWPGNIRELRNVVESAAAGSSGPIVEADEVERALEQFARTPREKGYSIRGLREAVALHGGNLSAAARAVGIPRSTLRDRMGRIR